MAVGLPLKTTYANGDVFSASDINDTNGTINLIGYGAPVVAGKNAVINSAFDIWQRGTSIAVAASDPNEYTADRWAIVTGANVASTVSRQATGDTTNLPNIQYCGRFQRNSGQTGTAVMYVSNAFETVNSIPFVGQQVTLSFYARRGANFSSASNILTSKLYFGTGTDQQSNTGYTGATAVINQNNTLTTTWQRFTATGTVGTTANELSIEFSFTPSGTAGANDYFEITGVQLERGASATTFSRNTSTYQAELAACQRYYYVHASGGDVGAIIGMGAMTGSNIVEILVSFPTSMRVIPTAISATGSSYYRFDRNGASDDFNSITGAYLSINGADCYNNTEISGTSGQAGSVRCINASSLLAFNAEL